MSVLDTIIKIDISLITQAVAQESFSIPLIIGPSSPSWSGKVHTYTDPKSMLSDGYSTSSPEYKYALELYEQDITPVEFLVGKRIVSVEQVDTITPTAINSFLYEITIDGVNYSYTSDASATVEEIVAGLLALVNADLNSPAIASGSVTLILTAKTAGVGFLTSVNANPNMALVNTIINHGIADDLNAIISENNTFYGIILCSNNKDDIIQLAAAVEAIKKIYGAVSSDSDVAENVSTDVFSILKSKNYDRTFPLYSPASANKGIEAAWMGGQLPQTPGSNNWAFKTLKGISADSISDNVRSILIGVPVAGIQGKNVNIYQTVGGKDITQMGTMASGQFIDIIIGKDWLETTIQSNIYQELVNASKIPYTNKGTSILVSAVKAALDLGVTNGLIDGTRPISVTAPNVENVPFSQRANRIAPNISFSCFFAGAINAVKVGGTVSV